MLAACPHCGAAVDTENGTYCSACGGQVLQAYGQPPRPQVVPTPESAPIRITPRYGRKRSRSSRVLAVLTTLILAGSSIGSALIIRSTVLQRDSQAKPIPSVAEPAQEPTARREVPRVSLPQRRDPAPNRSASGKFVAPTDEQIKIAEEGLTLAGEFSAHDFLEQAETRTHHPTLRFLLYRKCIDKAVAEGNAPIMMRAIDALIAQWDFEDPEAYRRGLQSKFATARRPTPMMPEPQVGTTEPTEKDIQASSVDRRNALILKATSVDLTRNRTSVPVSFSHVDIDQRSLNFEVTSIEGAVAKAYDPEDRRIKMGSKLRIVLRDTVPYAGIDVSLSDGGNSTIIVRLEPKLIPFDRKTYPWSMRRVQTLLTQSDSLVTQQAAAISLAEAELKSAEAAWKAIVLRYGDNTAAPNVVALKKAALARIERAKAAHAYLKAELPKSRECAMAAQELGKLTESVQDTAVVHFRLFYLQDGREIEIARTE